MRKVRSSFKEKCSALKGALSTGTLMMDFEKDQAASRFLVNTIDPDNQLILLEYRFPGARKFLKYTVPLSPSSLDILPPINQGDSSLRRHAPGQPPVLQCLGKETMPGLGY